MHRNQPPSNWKINFYTFLTGQFLTAVTSTVVQYAIIWYLTQKTGSATILSLAVLFGMMPTVLFSSFVGPLVDRLNKKLVLILSDLVVAAFALILALVGWLSGTFPMSFVFIVILIRATAQAFQMPTVQSMLPTMVPASEITRVNGQFGMVQAMNLVVAPALGIFLFSVIPIHWLILVDVIGAIIGTALLFKLKIEKVVSQGEEIHLFHDTKEGFKLLYQNKGIWYMTLILGATLLFLVPGMSLFPLITIEHFGGSLIDAGWVEVVFGLGTVVGGAIIGFFAKIKNRVLPLMLSIVIQGIFFALIGLMAGNRTGFIAFLIFTAIIGLANPFASAMELAMVQQSYQPQYLGRVMGVMLSIISLAGPLGMIFTGPLADQIGIQNIFVIGGIGTIFCGLSLVGISKIRNYDIALQNKIKVEEKQ